MFNRRRIKELECQVASLDAGYQEMRSRYWEVVRAHQRLLNHFGLTEQDIPRSIILTRCARAADGA